MVASSLRLKKEEVVSSSKEDLDLSANNGSSQLISASEGISQVNEWIF